MARGTGRASLVRHGCEEGYVAPGAKPGYRGLGPSELAESKAPGMSVLPGPRKYGTIMVFWAFVLLTFGQLFSPYFGGPGAYALEFKVS